MTTPDYEENTNIAPSSKWSIEATAWRGPLPSPEDLASYESVVKGAGERILKMAESAQAHEQSQENRILDLSDTVQRQGFTLNLLGATTGLIVVLSGVGLTFSGQERNGLALVGSIFAVWAISRLIRAFRGTGDTSDGSS
jgi:uncharacterized membrane protein